MDKDNLDLENILIDKPSEDDLREVPLDGKVFYYFAGIVTLLGLIVLFQVFRLGLWNNDFYQSAALANMTETRYKEAPRGLIKDKFNKPLLKNEQAFKVYLSPSDFPRDTAKRQKVLKKVSSVLKTDLNEIKKKLKDYDWSLGPPLLENNLTHQELVNLSTKDIKGIEIKPGFERKYPYPFSFSHLLGYVGPVTKEELQKKPELSLSDEIGKAGLEHQYDSYLRGEQGKRVEFMNAFGDVKDEIISKKPQPGSNLKTHIDMEMQKTFYRSLKRRVNNLESRSAVGIAMNPQNGSILSLVSIPGYDGDQIGDYLQKPANPLFNKAIKGNYNPGSTIKPLVALAALEEGIINPDKQFNSPGYLKVENPYNPDKPSIFKDWRAHGWVDMEEALARSSNVYFYILGGGHEAEKLYGLNRTREGLGIETLNKWWHKFNLGSESGIDLPDEGEGTLPDPEWKEENIGARWRVGDTYNASIGQGSFAVTPLSLLNYISTIANGGTLYRPNIAQKRETKKIKELNNISLQNIKEVKNGMESAVDKPFGTANLLSSLPMDIAAKTGSAEVGKDRVNALFVGFTPVEEPKLATLVLIENAEEGSINAVPVARELFSWYCNNRLEDCKS